jgi:cytochrome o ubiquinol oxidase subunit II
MILFDSLGIMLAIVIPTIVATLGVAFWFRSSNARAPHLPDWEYSGRLELIVWSIPAMTVLLVGGIAWIGAHDLDPRHLRRSRSPFRWSRSTGNGCSFIPTKASPASTV